MMQVPSAYVKGYAKAKAVDPVTADKYIKHTTIGDPELDPVMEEISSLPPGDLHRFTKAGIEQEEEVLRTAPQVLRDFFDKTDRDTPPWLDYNEFEPGQRAFYANLNNMLIAYAIGSAVEGFSTLVSKSFSITGRVTGGGAGAERRLRQNNRHMVEVYYPGGMQRDGDGWKVSMRIRFIHARVRKLLADSSLWEYEAWGVPLSAAHTGGISLFTFSIRQFEHACAMGSKVSTEQKESIIKIWRYAGYLLGVPESILFANEEEARKIYKIGHMCEPPPDSDAKNLANMVFKVLPTMAGLTDEAKRKVWKCMPTAFREPL